MFVEAFHRVLKMVHTKECSDKSVFTTLNYSLHTAGSVDKQLLSKKKTLGYFSLRIYNKHQRADISFHEKKKATCN